MNTEEFRNKMINGIKVTKGSELAEMFHYYSQEALKITAKLNNKYHSPEEIIKIFSKLTQQKVDKTFRLFPPFYTDCGVNIKLGKNVFINAGCKFQDQAGIEIGENAFIGHNVIIATLNHDQNPETRYDMTAGKVTIGNNVWIGSGAIILPGITVGNNSIIGAGSIVTKNVAENCIVAGNPARFIKNIEIKNK